MSTQRPDPVGAPRRDRLRAVAGLACALVVLGASATVVLREAAAWLAPGYAAAQAADSAPAQAAPASPAPPAAPASQETAKASSVTTSPKAKTTSAAAQPAKPSVKAARRVPARVWKVDAGSSTIVAAQPAASGPVAKAASGSPAMKVASSSPVAASVAVPPTRGAVAAPPTKGAVAPPLAKGAGSPTSPNAGSTEPVARAATPSGKNPSTPSATARATSGANNPKATASSVTASGSSPAPKAGDGAPAKSESTPVTAQDASTIAVTAESVHGSRPQAEKPEVQTPTPVEERINYQYNAIGRRDPFAQMVGVFVGDDVGGNAPVDVGGIKVVGIVWGSDQFAMVEDGRGNSMILRRGDKVMNGFVEDLKRDAVIVKLTMDGQSQSVAIPLARKGDQSNGSR